MASSSPVAAQDDDGLRNEVGTTYWVLPDEGAVAVVISFSARNEVPDRRQGNQILQTFFTSVREFIPIVATDVAATRSNGTALSVTPADLPADAIAELKTFGLQAWDIDLGPNLFYQQTREFELTYRLPDGPSRSEDAWARVNGATAAFPVFARGDRGLSTVSVVFPPGFAVDSLGAELIPNDVAAPTVWSATGIADPVDWSSIVVGFSDEGLQRTVFEVEGFDEEISIASWPGDEDWVGFVSNGVRRGLPALVDATGVAFPIEDEIEILQTFAPSLEGYGGWYYEPEGVDAPDAVIEVGEELDLDLLLHELAHSWFNSDFTSMRWLNEGMAEYFAVEVAEEIAPGSGDPFPVVDADDPSAVRLVQWNNPGFDIDREREAYGYAASYQVIDAIAEEIGPEALADVVVALFEGRNPYRDDLTTHSGLPVTWHHFLDAVEIVGGSDDVEQLLTTWVVSDSVAGRLEDRRSAIEAVATLDRAPDWTTPDVIPERLAQWRFAVVEDLVEESHELFDAVVAIEDRAAERSIVLPDDPRLAYERGADVDTGFATTWGLVEEQRDVLDAVLAAFVRADTSPSLMASIGLLGEDVDAVVVSAQRAFEAGDFEDALSQAATVAQMRDDAADVGRQRVLVAGSVLVVVAFLSVGLTMLVRRRQG